MQESGLPFLDRMLAEISAFHGTPADYKHPEIWRRSIPQYGASYMHSLYLSHDRAFKKGFYEFSSPITGLKSRSINTCIARGGGHRPSRRGNTGMLTLWGFVDSQFNEEIFYLGTMDVFGWFTHLIIPSRGLAAVIVPCDDEEWYELTFDSNLLPHNIKDLPTTKQVIRAFGECGSLRHAFVGISESIGHAVWNDLSGFLTYSRTTAFEGFDLTFHRIPFSILSKALSTRTINHVLPVARVNDLSQSFGGNEYAQLEHTVFRPIDFTLNLRRVYNVYNSMASKSSTPFEFSDNSGFVLWVNLRSPLEVKRAICINYPQLITNTAKHLHNAYGFTDVKIVLDGWTGSACEDIFTETVYKHHLALASALRADVSQDFSAIYSLVGLSFDEKAEVVSNAKNNSRLLALCQYGSGISFGAVLGNDMALVLNSCPFNDPILYDGRKNTIFPADLIWKPIIGEPINSFDNKSAYNSTLAKISREAYPNKTSEYYAVNEDSFVSALHDVLQSALTNGKRKSSQAVNTNYVL